MSVSSQQAAEIDQIREALLVPIALIQPLRFKYFVIRNIISLRVLWNAFVIVSSNDFSLLRISFL